MIGHPALTVATMGLFLLTSCADHPPAVIENKSTLAVEEVPEIRGNTREPGLRARAADRAKLCCRAWRHALLGGFSSRNGSPNAGGIQ